MPNSSSASAYNRVADVGWTEGMLTSVNRTLLGRFEVTTTPDGAAPPTLDVARTEPT